MLDIVIVIDNRGLGIIRGGGALDGVHKIV